MNAGNHPRGFTVVEKIAGLHRDQGTGAPERVGSYVDLRPRRILTHDNSHAVIRKFERLGATRIHDPGTPVIALDHDVQNRSERNVATYREIESFAGRHGLRFHPAGTGVGHQVLCDRLHVLPGSLVVASDSHANLYGALGALGTPVVRTDAAGVWATGTFWWRVPETVEVVLGGRLRPGVSAKDLALTLIARWPIDRVDDRAIEFSGDGVASLSVAERMTIANLTTEWGALTGWFPADAVTFAWLRERLDDPGPDDDRGAVERAIESAEVDPLFPDPDAVFAIRLEIDLATVSPLVTGPNAVERARPVAEVERERIRIDKAYLLSCANGRAEDFREAAAALDGRRVADGVELWIAAASAAEERRARADGSWDALLAAGARPLPSGCGPCIGLGAGTLEPGETGISATNRNFPGRMGSTDASCWLASPAIVAASATAGRIVRADPDVAPIDLVARETAPRTRSPFAPAPPPRSEGGTTWTVRGRAVVLDADLVDTDALFEAALLYRGDLTQDDLRNATLRRFDLSFAARVRPGDVLIAGARFGIGSSREQAVSGLLACGIRVLVATSIGDTFRRNAVNLGLPCVECPGLVREFRDAARSTGGGAREAWIPGTAVALDLAAGIASVEDRTYRFEPLGGPARTLIEAGGLEPLLRRRIRS